MMLKRLIFGAFAANMVGASKAPTTNRVFVLETRDYSDYQLIEAFSSVENLNKRLEDCNPPIDLKDFKHAGTVGADVYVYWTPDGRLTVYEIEVDVIKV